MTAIAVFVNLSFHWQRAAWTAMLMLFVVVGSLACRSSLPRPADFSPLQNPDPLLRTGTPEELKALLDRRTRGPRTMQAQGRVTVSVENQRRQQWFDANLLYRAPDRVRLRGSRVGPGTLFEVLAAPEESWFYLNGDRDLYVGTVEDLRQHLGLLGSVDLAELMGALLVSQEVQRLLAEDLIEDWRVRRSDIEFTDSRLGRNRRWTIDRQSGLVRRMEFREAGRNAEAIVEYDKYDFAEAPEILPAELRVILPREGVTVRLRLSSYRLDPELREDIVFESRPRGAREVYPLWQLNWDGPDDAPEPES